MINKDKILDLIKNKSLSADDASMWDKFLGTLPDDLASDIYAYLVSNDKAIYIVTDNLREKITALENRDLDAWEDSLKRDVGDILADK